jgi:AcrR family transcriptional regulator
MESSDGVKRRYRSALREEQARATRRRIIDVALRLFVEHGFVATSMDAVAAGAGVSRATVFGAFGTKATLLKRAYDVALVGDDDPVALVDRPNSRRVRAEPDAARYLRGYTGIACDVMERLAPIYEAIRGAAGADPQARAVWEAIHVERLRGAAHVIADLRDRAPLRAGLSVDAARDVLYACIDPGLFHVLARERGWTRTRFERWLAGVLARELLGVRGGEPPSA